MLQMERQGRRLEPNLAGDDTSRQPFGTVLDQQTKDRQTVFVGQSTESSDRFDSLHGFIRYYENYRNVKR
jgi:hypothetical protein